MCNFKSLKMRSRFASFWLVEIWNGALWLVGRLLSPGASRENPLLSLKQGALWSRAVSPPGGATRQLCRRFWWVEISHVTNDVTVPHLHITWPLYGGCNLVCCHVVLRWYGHQVRYESRSNVSTVLFGLEKSRDLWRHTSSPIIENEEI